MEFGKTSSIIISLILGWILTFLFDNVFVITFVGFISTYIVRKESKSFMIGVIAALLFTILNFFGGLIIPPNIPSYIAENIGFDLTNFIIGFLVTCVLAGILGFLGGFIAEKAYKRINPEEFKNN
ncbi:hypothetical protein ALNOE001_10130 [Candidatus Methanobinarius endosymbioticus]|uniref:Uncharacterized protein n=1 Tax=Candidatus Methanobinarius endosymbioticus TaxID=2006182 RepID=A0A366MCK9_9EURY|nr:hypothetical protein ALNOE001_10130 [Candidatus Methanobinarius endosymbioticus]